jgi:hypothetical protein
MCIKDAESYADFKNIIIKQMGLKTISNKFVGIIPKIAM